MPYPNPRGGNNPNEGGRTAQSQSQHSHSTATSFGEARRLDLRARQHVNADLTGLRGWSELFMFWGNWAAFSALRLRPGIVALTSRNIAIPCQRLFRRRHSLTVSRERIRSAPTRGCPGWVVFIVAGRGTRSAGCRLADAGEWCTVDLRHAHTTRSPPTPDFPRDGSPNLKIK